MIIIDQFEQLPAPFLCVLAVVLWIAVKDIELPERWLKTTRFLACAALIAYVICHLALGHFNYGGDMLYFTFRGAVGAYIVNELLLLGFKIVHFFFRRS